MLWSLCCLALFTAPPPEAAEILGYATTPGLEFHTLYRREAPAPREAAWTIAAVEIANCGGNRFVFGVHFLDTYELTKSERIADVLREALPAGVAGISGFGKGFGQATRVAPPALSRLHELSFPGVSEEP